MWKGRILERKSEACVFFKYRGNNLSRTVARWISISSSSSPSNKSTKQTWYYRRLSSYLRISAPANTFWRSSWKDLNGRIPGCGEYGVDNWILWVLGAHEKHVLCRKKARTGEGEICECVRSVSSHTNKKKHTHVAHQNVYQCRWPQALNTLAGPWGKWSTCSLDSCDLPCHSVLENTQKTSMCFRKL